MLEIKIDLVPFGIEENRRQIHNLFIANVGHAYGSTYKYKAWNKKPWSLRTKAAKEKHCVATVLHDQNDTAWMLLKEILEATNGKV